MIGGPGTIVRRLFLRITLTIVLVCLVFVGSLMLEFSSEGQLVKRRTLQSVAERIAAEGVVDGQAGVAVWSLEGERILGASEWRTDAAPDLPLTYGEHAFQLGHDVETKKPLISVNLLVSGAAVGLPEASYILQVARPALPVDLIAWNFLIATLDEMWWVFALLLIATLVGVKATIDRSMAPISAASEQAARISARNPEERLAVETLPKEVAPLAISVNEAFDRLHQIYEAERSFTSAAAHELRTPLSVLRTRIERIDDAALRELALGDIDRAARTVGQLLQFARIDALPARSGEDVGVLEATRRYLSTNASRILDHGGCVELVDRAGDDWRMNAVLLEIVLGNLIDNALKHGGDAPRIRVVVEADRLTVEDSGPGVAATEREDVFRLFWRREFSSTDGAGVGLALVARIAELTGGGVSVGRSDLGGAAFSLLRVAEADRSRAPKTTGLTTDAGPRGEDPALARKRQANG